MVNNVQALQCDLFNDITSSNSIPLIYLESTIVVWATGLCKRMRTGLSIASMVLSVPPGWKKQRVNGLYPFLDSLRTARLFYSFLYKNCDDRIAKIAYPNRSTSFGFYSTSWNVFANLLTLIKPVNYCAGRSWGTSVWIGCEQARWIVGSRTSILAAELRFARRRRRGQKNLAPFSSPALPAANLTARYFIVFSRHIPVNKLIFKAKTRAKSRYFFFFMKSLKLTMTFTIFRKPRN